MSATPGVHLVVDGSNIATEGRSVPSLMQLDEAVRAFLEEYPHEHWTVVVDATFEHRIDSSEESHADSPWLFEEGRLIGGKPVPGIGWVFAPRSPVRGAKSRMVTRAAKKKAGKKAAPAPTAPEQPPVPTKRA